MFGSLKKAFGAGAKEIQADYSQNRDYLEAVCAAAALVAYADGELEDTERTKAISIVVNHPTLGKMYQQNVIEQTVDSMFKRAKDGSGRNALAGELDDIKSRDNGPKMADDVYLIAQDIAMADGEIEPQEKDVLAKIAKRLGVDTSKFEF